MFKGRSRCASCGHTLAARDLIPVLSFLSARGRCRHCGEKIPAECLWAELAGSAAFICIGIRFGISVELFQWLVMAILLLSVSFVDAATRLIPGRLLLAMVINRAAFLPFLDMPLPDSLKTALISFCIVPLPLLALTLAMEHMLGREVMGGGDIKLLMAMALYLDGPQMLLTLLCGCLLGIAGTLIGRKQGAFPFGPYLTAACVTVVCFGGPLITWYMSLW